MCPLEQVQLVIFMYEDIESVLWHTATTINTENNGDILVTGENIPKIDNYKSLFVDALETRDKAIL